MEKRQGSNVIPSGKRLTKKMIAYTNRIGTICQNLDAIMEITKEDAKEVNELGRNDQKFYDETLNKMKSVDIPESLRVYKTTDKNREITKLKNMLAHNLLKQGSE